MILTRPWFFAVVDKVAGVELHLAVIKPIERSAAPDLQFCLGKPLQQFAAGKPKELDRLGPYDANLKRAGLR